VNVQSRTLEDNADCESRAGIVRVVHVISAVDVIDVDVVRVVPVGWPGFDEPKPIPAVAEARVSANQNWVANVEVVFAPKMRAEALIRNSTVSPGAQAQRRLCAMSGFFLPRALGSVPRSGLLLVMLLLLPSSLLLVVLCGLIFLWLALLLLFLLPFGLLLFLPYRPILLLLLMMFLSFSLLLLICGPVLLLVLFLLSVGLLLSFRFSVLFPFRSLRLLLSFRLGFLLLSLGLGSFFLFLRLILPCVSRRGDSEKQKKNGCTHDSSWLHDVISTTCC
jgi:hypothetical protein